MSRASLRVEWMTSQRTDREMEREKPGTKNWINKKKIATPCGGARLQRKFATNVVCQLVRKFRLRGERRVPQNYFYIICPRVRVCVSLAWRAFRMGSRTKHQFLFLWASPRGRRGLESKSFRSGSLVCACVRMCVCIFTRKRSWTLATVAVSMCARKTKWGKEMLTWGVFGILNRECGCSDIRVYRGFGMDTLTTWM